MTEAVDGKHHHLLRDHLTNMTTIQVKVCTLALDEYDQLVKRAALLKDENDKLLAQLAGLVRPKRARR